MKKRLYEVCIEIGHLKKALRNLWQQRGKVDQEILNLAEQVDNLILEYDQLLLNKSNNTTQILTMLIGIKDKQLLEHGKRLEELISGTGFALKLSNEVMKNLLLLAQFHDVGKLGIPDNILFKGNPLTEDEFIIIKQHCEIGYGIAKASFELFDIAHLILKHHEWWNGEGYPLGLKENEIPLECRILAIMDAFDAMTNSRPYRYKLSHEDAIKELIRNAGTQFDPFILEKVKDILYEFFLDYQKNEIYDCHL